MYFSTAGLRPEVRAAGYEAAIRDFLALGGFSAEVSVAPERPRLIDASIQLFQLNDLHGAVHRTNAPHQVVAAPPISGGEGLDLYVVTKGALNLATDAGDIALRAGDMALLRSEAALEAFSPEVEMITLSMPATLAATHPLGRGLAADRSLPGGTALSACLTAMLSTAIDRQEHFANGEEAVLQSALVDSVLFLAAADRDATEPDLSVRQTEILAGLKTIALRALDEPDLNPQRVAHEAGVSVRTLHRLFNASGVTFRNWLRAERLERCRRELADPGLRRRTIAAVAFGWGFNDISTFNRAFREQYDLTPQALRRGLV